jgi:pyrrolidone-carboxylate peptidase
MILVYAFANNWGTNISRRVLSELELLLGKDNINYQIVYFSPQRFFDKYINGSNYDLIVGLGDFNSSIIKIRMETVAHNRFGEKSINPLSPYCLELSMPEMDIVDTNKFSVGVNMGSYNCNYLTFKIQEMINNHQENLKQLFFHIGKLNEAKSAAENIANLMVVNKMSRLR